MLLNVNWSIKSNFHKGTKIRFSGEMCIRQTCAIAVEKMSVQDFGVRRITMYSMSKTARLINELDDICEQLLLLFPGLTGFCGPWPPGER